MKYQGSAINSSQDIVKKQSVMADRLQDYLTDGWTDGRTDQAKTIYLPQVGGRHNKVALTAEKTKDGITC